MKGQKGGWMCGWRKKGVDGEINDGWRDRIKGQGDGWSHDGGRKGWMRDGHRDRWRDR